MFMLSLRTRRFGAIAWLSFVALPSLGRAQDFRSLGDDFHRDAEPPRAKPPLPPDPPAPPFGARGEWVVTGASSLGLSGTTYGGSEARYFSVAVSPGVDWFFAENVSAGIDLNSVYSFAEGYGADGSLVASNTTTMSGGVRLGYNLPLGARFSLYTRLTVGFEWVHFSETLVSGQSLSIAGAPLGYPSTTNFGPWVEIYAPVLLHVASHAFVGFGPYLFREFGSTEGVPDVGGQRTGVGAAFVVGGWSGGPASPESAPVEVASIAAPRPRRFGEAGEFVVASDFVASIDYTSYTGSPSSSFAATLAPSVDYFVADHVSFGATLQLSYGSVTGFDAAPPAGSPPGQVPVTNVVKSAGFGPRISFDIPLGPRFSLYPQAYLIFGADSYDETSATSTNSNTESFVTAGLYAPLLVHPAQHFFIGFGPSATQDLSRVVSSTAQNRATTLGAGLVVGAWM
jgi:hypothetical protein